MRQPQEVQVFASWTDAPCGYPGFTANYDASAQGALHAGWPYEELLGGHFHMFVDAPSVADTMIALTEQIAVRLPRNQA